MKVEKDGIIKDVEENILADYKSAGWKIYKKETKPKKDETKNNVEDEVEGK